MRLLALILLLVPCSGCVVPSEPLEDWLTPRAFEAWFRDDGGEDLESLRLSGLATVPDVDGTPLTGYRLDYTFHVSGGRNVTWVLDQNMRIISEVFHCRGEIPDCSNESWISWARRGDLAPFGVGIPMMLAKHGEVESYLGDSSWPIDASVEAGSPLVVQVSAPYAGGFVHTWNTTLTFDTGTMFPAAEGRLLESYHDLGELPAVVDSVTPRPTDSRSPEDQPFPGFDTPILDWGLSARDLVDLAKNETSSGSCLVLFDVRPGAARSQEMLPPTEDIDLGTVEIALGTDGGAMTFRLEVRQRAFYGDVVVDTERTMGVPASTTCENLARTPATTVSMADAVEAASSWMGDVDEITSLTLFRTDQTWDGRVPEAGWQRWRVSFPPAENVGVDRAFYNPYFVEMRAWDGSLSLIAVHPDDIPLT